MRFIRNKNHRGFAHLWLLVLVVVTLVGFGGWRVYNNQVRRGANQQQIQPSANSTSAASQQKGGYDTGDLAKCSGNGVLTQAFADPSSYKDIIPLGNNSSWNGNVAHVIPVNHMYFEYGGPPTDSNGSPIEVIPVVAPGDIKILQVIATDHVNSSGVHTLSDSSVYFAACQDVIFWFGHIQDLNPVITAAMDSAKKTCNSSFVIDGLTYNNCTYSLDLKLKAGTSVGKGGLDFGTIDYRIKPQAFLRPSSQQYLYSVCGLDYFTEPAKTAMYKKVENTKIDSNGLPDCGTDMWDKAGTLQGNWFLPSAPANGSMDSYALTITPFNIDPSQGDIDWGGTIAPADRIHFKMTSSGTLNRDPSVITADGQVYCFQDVSQGYTYASSIMLQLVDATTLKAQYHKGVCPSTPSLINPTTYVR